MDKTLILRIEGRVQGVGYRAWAVRAARGLQLSGWVRNCADGAVEALISGPGEAVDRFLAAAHRGPPAAQVSRVTAEPSAVTAPLPFSERPTV